MTIRGTPSVSRNTLIHGVSSIGRNETYWPTVYSTEHSLTFWRRNYFFLILAHPVYKMWIIQEPNKLELWNKLHFEKEKTESIYHV